MRIVYFYQYFGTPKGGWSTRVYELTKRWVQKGHQVTVVTSLYDKSDLKASGLVSTQMIEGIEVRVINVQISNKHHFAYRIFTFFKFAILSVYYAVKLDYDVAIASSGPITIGLPGLAARYIRKKPMIFEVRDLWPEGAVQLGLLKSGLSQKLAYWFEKKCYKAASSIIALSEGMAASIRDRYGYGNVHVITNASDNNLFGGAGILQEDPGWMVGKKLVVYTGTLGLMDNCSQIIEAARVLQERKREDILILFIGDGKEREYLEELSEKYQLGNVKFLGLMPKENVVYWLKQALGAFLVFKNVPVLDTCSPNKMFDAYAAGVPIIQTTRGWIKDLIEEQKCGINVMPNLPEEMADAVELLADNPALREELAMNAKKVAITMFDRDLLAEQMLQIIEETAGKRYG